MKTIPISSLVMVSFMGNEARDHVTFKDFEGISSNFSLSRFTGSEPVDEKKGCSNVR